MCFKLGLRHFSHLARCCFAQIFDAIHSEILSSLLNVNDNAQPVPHACTLSQGANKLSVIISACRADDFCSQFAAPAIWNKFSNNITSFNSKCSLLYKIDAYYVSLF